jgi:hypothetical protein
MPQLWIERELETLLGLVRLLDERLVNLSEKSVEVDDADAYGYFDTMEHVVGLAMVVCQTYIAAVCGAVALDKKIAMKIGAAHSDGMAKIEIINHAANYWKHNNEWAGERSDRRRKAIEAAFDTVGFSVGTDYPLSGVLTELSDPKAASLEVLSVILSAWKITILSEK